TKAEDIDADDPSTYTPAMRFHARGGANPARLLPGYKTPAEGDPETNHGSDVVVMRYARDENGEWPAKRPPMRVRTVGPLQERILRTGRSLKVRGLKAPRPNLRRIKRPSIHAPSIPSLRVGETLRGIKQSASRLRRRGEKQPEEGAAEAAKA